VRRTAAVILNQKGCAMHLAELKCQPMMGVFVLFVSPTDTLSVLAADWNQYAVTCIINLFSRLTA
jgi:hypothetical protein